MASHADAGASNLETPITIKVIFDGSNRKFKLPLQDLTVAVFAEKIRSILQIPLNQSFLLERFSDSGNAYITLDQSNPSAYKQLYRAAKAKLKLRIRATLLHNNSSNDNINNNATTASTSTQTQEPQKRELPTTEPSTQPVVTKLYNPYAVNGNGLCSEPKAGIGARDFSCVQARDQFFQQLANISREREMGRRMKEAPAQPSSNFWQIFCNNCDKPMADAHFHCSICDGGDYDLCESCVEAGKICPGEGHWLIKRFIKSGKVVTSATETLPPKPREVVDEHRDIPGAFGTDVKIELPVEPSRTCNACVKVLPESALVTCKDCPDYDLCVPCLKVEEGHHPGHSFAPTNPATVVTEDVATVCSPGRHTRHHAICDGCDKAIYGVRHKCLNCPDWDFCGNCFQTAKSVHPGHRFVPVYSNLDVATAPRSVHCGILCDGPLCTNKPGKAYIRGIRYKCSVCHDTDFCANCESHPSNKHNESHPLIMFKLPVRGAHVTVVDETPGRPRFVAGDRQIPVPRAPARSPSLRSVATLPPYTLPSAPKLTLTPEVKSVASQTKMQEKTSSGKQSSSNHELDAHFVKDQVADGTRVPASTSFRQTWTLKNPGPNAWPAGCSVHFVGGDNMAPNMQALRDQPLSTIDLSCTNSTMNVVEPGQSHDFSVWMRAPLRVGKHISYWRLKTPGGVPFGHKLWCDIETTQTEQWETQLRFLEQLNQKRLATAQRPLASSLDSMSGSIVSPPTAPQAAAPAVSTENEEAVVRSVMVFPTLDKESPTSSTLRETPAMPQDSVPTVTVPKAAGPQSDGATETETETATTTTSVPEVEERFEDLESVEYEDSDTENDGFLTDEEYDILDASDEEFSNRGRAAM